MSCWPCNLTTLISATAAGAWQDWQTGLFLAVQNGREAVVQLLIEHKAEVDAANQVLHAAVLGGVVRVVQLLLEAGADPAVPNGAGETALSLAVLAGQWECAEALVLSPGGAGAVQAQDRNGWTCLHHAAPGLSGPEPHSCSARCCSTAGNCPPISSRWGDI
mmetsp:Transcript_54978/g.115050  ORF Transcript_54978/g.115050 Transcript_54978/m.115050 type:complete len:162 (+) Transcript_54978:801-1286(+)